MGRLDRVFQAARASERRSVDDMCPASHGGGRKLSGILVSLFTSDAQGAPMPLPTPVAQLWDELDAVRAEVLAEAAELSQAQADWKPSEQEWSVGEIIDHLTIAENATGKLTTKLMKEAAASGTPAVF